MIAAARFGVVAVGSWWLRDIRYTDADDDDDGMRTQTDHSFDSDGMGKRCAYFVRMGESFASAER